MNYYEAIVKEECKKKGEWRSIIDGVTSVEKGKKQACEEKMKDASLKKSTVWITIGCWSSYGFEENIGGTYWMER